MDEGALRPIEAAYIATNSYFTLKDWVHNKPVAGTESRTVIRNRVLGDATAGTAEHGNSSLGGRLDNAKLGKIHEGTTGFNTRSGFGYTMTFTRHGQKHVVIATRGTRPELGKPDLLTDAHGSMTNFGQFGLVHHGFKRTFDSVIASIANDSSLTSRPDGVHCVGHSLGGGVATLLAGHFAAAGLPVRLYTFGCPRVGVLQTYAAFHQYIGQNNIYRVAHDLDPISLIGPYPYIHTNPRPQDPNNITLPSPSGQLLSTVNHDMAQYIAISERLGSWEGLRRVAQRVQHNDGLLVKWLLHEDNDSGWWIQKASVSTLAILFKMFNWVLKGISTSLILGLTAVDVLAEVIWRGAQLLGRLGSEILTLLKHAAKWAGIKITEGANFSMAVIRALLSKMLATLRGLAMQAINIGPRNTHAVDLSRIGLPASGHRVI